MKRFRVEFHEDDRYQHALVIDAENMPDALTLALASPKCPAAIVEIPTGQHFQMAQHVKIATAEDIFPRLAIAAEMAEALEIVTCAFDEMHDVEMPFSVGMAAARAHLAAQKALAKFRGEVEGE